MAEWDELSEAVKALHRQCQADYAKGYGASSLERADKATEQTMNVLAGQRSANRRWGVDPQPSADETRPANLPE